MHTGQHYDDELSRVFFDELGVPPPGARAARRHRLEHRADRADAGGARARCSRELEPAIGPGLRRHELDAGGRAGGGPGQRSRSPTSRPGMRSFDRAMPEELNRVLVDHASDLLLCSTQAAMDNLASERRGRRAPPGGRRDGRRVAQLQADRRGALDRARGPRPRPTASTCWSPRTGPGPSMTRRASSCWSSCSRRCRSRRCFPVHPRTAARLEDDRPARRGWRRPRTCVLTPPLGYLDFLKLAAHARAVLTDSGGVQKEALILGVPVRDDARHDRVGRDGRGRLERAGRPGRRRRALQRSNGPARRASRPISTAAGRPPSGSATRSPPTLCRDEDRDHRAGLRRRAAGGRLRRSRA